MSNFAILRVSKKSHMSEIQRMARHHLRTLPVDNADPAKPIEVLIGSPDADEVVGLIRDVVTPLSKRKDSIKCLDVLMTASPEFFRNGGSVEDFKKHALGWAKETFGVDNVVSAVMHLDETTPHIQLLTLPIHKGKLQAKHWTGDPKKLREMQSSFAKALEPLGLRRGVEGSKAKHTSISQWYGELKPRMEAAKQLIDDAKSSEENIVQQKAQIDARAEKLEVARVDIEKMQNELVERSIALNDRENNLTDKEKAIERRDKETMAEAVALNEQRSKFENMTKGFFEWQEKLRMAFYKIPSKIQDEIKGFFGNKDFERFLGVELKKPAPKPVNSPKKQEEELKQAATAAHKVKPR